MRQVLFLLWAAIAAGCGVNEDQVRREISAANHCDTAADCGDAGSFCPYGCNVLVNRSEVQRIRDLLSRSSDNRCLYDCAQLLSVSCEAGSCVGRYQ